jgi:hypothetical protein
LLLGLVEFLANRFDFLIGISSIPSFFERRFKSEVQQCSIDDMAE